MDSVQMTVIQQVVATITPRDHNGNPATVVGVPTWAVDNSALITLKAASDGMSCTCVAVGAVGTATVTASAVNTAGTTLTDTGTITIIAAVLAAESLNLKFETPSDQVPSQPPPPVPPV